MEKLSAATFYPLFLGLLFGSLIYNASGESNTDIMTCRCSPIDFIPAMVQGRATLSLPPFLSELSLLVKMAYMDRDGIKVLKLIPIISDKGKCSEYPGGDGVLCYQHSEIHWGSNSEEGSDHSISGFSYPMEMQHYFHHTDYNVSLAEVAVGVLFTQIDSLSPNESSSFDDLRHHSTMAIHTQYSEYMKNNTAMVLNLTNFLPSDLENSAYFQYREACGHCSYERDWLVYEEPLPVVESFLKFLRTVSKEGDVNHLSASLRGDCVLYSHFVSENAESFEKCGHIDPMPRVNLLPESTDETENVENAATDRKLVPGTETPVDSETTALVEGMDAITDLPASTVTTNRITPTHLEESEDQNVEVSQVNDYTVGSEESFQPEVSSLEPSYIDETTENLPITNMYDTNRPLPRGEEEVELITAPSDDKKDNSSLPSSVSKFEFVLIVSSLVLQFYL